MSIRKVHELHERRRSRNVGVGLVLAALITIFFGLTIVKVSQGDYQVQPTGVTDGN